MTKKKVYIETYGCWLNKGESKIVESIIRRRGAEIVNTPEQANVVIINTCAVRGETEYKMLRRIRELEKLRGKYGFRLIISGCIVNVRPYTISKISPEASLIESDAIEEVANAVLSDKRVTIIRQYNARRKVLPRHMGEVTYVVPIQTGCLGTCTFCIERVSRGRGVKSYPLDLIVNAVKDAVKGGAREIYLTGQDVATYGVDLGYTLIDLLKTILSEVKGDYRIRLGMMEPWLVSRFVKQLAEIMYDQRVYNYLHLPVQSGDNGVLRLMGRKYSITGYEKLVRVFRDKLGRLCLVTDIIVGFPGEKEGAFRNTLELLERIKFDKVHIARYTLRPFTKAYMLPQIPEPEKKRRSRIASEIALRIAYEINRGYIGYVADAVVTENTPKGSFIARTPEYKPVILEEGVKPGEIVKVKVIDATPIYLIGRIID